MNPQAWADGFGRWHASVPVSSSPAKDARAARALIRKELKERLAPNFDPRTLRVVLERHTGHGTVIYMEA